MTAHDVFRRAVQKGLAVLGQPCLLQGTPCGSVNIARNVQVYAAALDQANDNHVVRADVASIGVEFSPKVGQILEHSLHGRFKLTRLADDDGHKRKFIVVALP
jgi:hypothetical protein